MIARVVAVIAGLWLMFAPAVFGYGDPAAANDRIFGPVAASLSFVAMWEVVRPLRWGTLPVGLWLVGAPFALQYGAAAAIISSVVSGLVLAATAPLGGQTRQRYGGGWRTLLPGRPVPAVGPPQGEEPPPGLV